MSKLIFNAVDVRRVVEHSIGSPAQLKTYARIPEVPSVLLVHDDGVYLMSNGTPRDLLDKNAEDKLGARSYVAYAQGCNPKKDPRWWDRSCELVGGDDFAELLPASDLHAMIVKGAKTIAIDLTADSMTVIAAKD